MPTRRDILQWGLFAGSGLLLPSKGLRTHAPDTLTYSLFFDEEALEGIRQRYLAYPLFQPLREELDAFDWNAEQLFLEGEVRLNDHLFHMLRLSRTATKMGFYFLMTGRQDTADLAIETIRTIMKFERWDYFLDGTTPIGFQRASKATFAVALCSDWLGNQISDDERDQWLRVMGEKGCEACYWATYGMRYQDRVEGWAIDPTSTYFEHRPGDRSWDLSNWPRFFDNNNLKSEPASALASGAIAHELQFGESDTSKRWLEQAIHSISGYQTIFEQDGSYNEGISYAGYTSHNLMQGYSILKRFKGLDLSDQLNWPGFMDYSFGLSMPTHNDPSAVINFGDVGNGLPSAVALWIAAHTNDPTAHWFAHHRSPTQDLWSVLWYPEKTYSTPRLQKPVLWRSDLEWIVSRTGYEIDDLVVAMRSGPPFNHEHGDRNTIIVKCFGEQLVTDPHRPSYTRTDPTWLMRGTVGHSGILIDGQGHQYVDGSEGTNASDARARLVRFGEREGHHFWSSDATQAYNLVLPDVQLVMRTVLVLYDVPAVVLIDKVVKGEQPSSMQTRFFGYNSDGNGVISAEDHTLEIARPHARLRVKSYSPQGLTSTADHLPMPEDIAQKYPYGEFSSRLPSTHLLTLSTLIPERSSDLEGLVTYRAHEDNRYEIELNVKGKRVIVDLVDSGSIPEFTLTGA